jgi:hypothetical protein
MVYNVKKCGLLSNTEAVPDLVLQGQPIPTVSGYKYLGFLVGREGIDFERHVENQAGKTRALMKYVEIRSFDWNPAIRWAIYRAFVRPQLEYGAPLTYAASQDRRGLLSEFEDVQAEGMRWVFHGSSGRNHALMEGILGILPLAKRFSHLRCRFQLQLRNMADRNPLRDLVEGAEPTRFLARFRSDPLFTAFSKEPFEGKPGPALDNFLLGRRREHIGGMRQTLLQNISPSSRTKGLLDKVFKAPPDVQLDFVLWRKGSLFLNRKCVCGKAWKRSHVACMPTVNLSEEGEGEFRRDRAGMSENFNRLDWLLNNGEWALAGETIGRWRKSLEEVTKQAGIDGLVRGDSRERMPLENGVLSDGRGQHS